MAGKLFKRHDDDRYVVGLKDYEKSDNDFMDDYDDNYIFLQNLS